MIKNQRKLVFLHQSSAPPIDLNWKFLTKIPSFQSQFLTLKSSFLVKIFNVLGIILIILHLKIFNHWVNVSICSGFKTRIPTFCGVYEKNILFSTILYTLGYMRFEMLHGG